MKRQLRKICALNLKVEKLKLRSYNKINIST